MTDSVWFTDQGREMDAEIERAEGRLDNIRSRETEGFGRDKRSNNHWNLSNGITRGRRGQFRKDKDENG